MGAALIRHGSARTVAIVNPRAQSGAAEGSWATIRSGLRARLPGLQTRMTEGPGHATQLCRAALEAGAELVISVGGDGTCNEVLAGFVDEAGDNRFPDACLGILAAGTGGDFQRMFGRVRIERQVARMIAAPVRSVDYGVAHYVDGDGQPQTRPFLNVASIGVSGEVVRRVNAASSSLGPTATYLLGTLQGIAAWRNLPVEIASDGEAPRRVDLTLGIVANGQYFGAGMWVCPDAAIDDGRFDTLEVTGMSRRTLVATLAKVFGARHLRVRGVAHRRAKQVELRPIAPTTRVPIELDGEDVGWLPARFEIRPAALRLRLS